MGLFKFKDFFKKEETPKEQPKIDLPEEELFNIEKYNEWFCNEYGKGRLDKEIKCIKNYHRYTL